MPPRPLIADKVAIPSFPPLWLAQLERFLGCCRIDSVDSTGVGCCRIDSVDSKGAIDLLAKSPWLIPLDKGGTSIVLVRVDSTDYSDEICWIYWLSRMHQRFNTKEASWMASMTVTYQFGKDEDNNFSNYIQRILFVMCFIHVSIPPKSIYVINSYGFHKGLYSLHNL